MTTATNSIAQPETKIEPVAAEQPAQSANAKDLMDMMGMVSEGMHSGMSIALWRFCNANKIDLNPSPVNSNVSGDFIGFLMAEYKEPGPQYIYPFKESIKQMYDTMIAKQFDIISELWKDNEAGLVFQIGKIIGQMQTSVFLRSHFKDTKELVLQIRHMT